MYCLQSWSLFTSYIGCNMLAGYFPSGSYNLADLNSASIDIFGLQQVESGQLAGNFVTIQYMSVGEPDTNTMSSYLLAICTFTPLYGRLCNVLGRRGANQIAVILAGVGTLACGLSNSMELLITARFVCLYTIIYFATHHTKQLLMPDRRSRGWRHTYHCFVSWVFYWHWREAKLTVAMYQNYNKRYVQHSCRSMRNNCLSFCWSVCCPSLEVWLRA